MGNKQLQFAYCPLSRQLNAIRQENLVNMRNILLEKSLAKCGGGTIPRSFSKKSKLRISPDQ